MGFVYILQSQTNNQYYIGCSEDPHRRIEEHNNGLVNATKSKDPWVLVFEQNFDNMTIARKIEAKLKRFKNREIIERIIDNGIIKMSV